MKTQETKSSRNSEDGLRPIRSRKENAIIYQWSYSFLGVPVISRRVDTEGEVLGVLIKGFGTVKNVDAIAMNQVEEGKLCGNGMR